MTSKQLYLRLLRYVRPHWRMFALALTAIVIGGLTEPVLPALLKPLLDGSFVAKDPFYITWMPVLIAVVFLFRGAVEFAGNVAMKWVANRVVMDLRNEMFAKLLLLPDRYFHHHPSGAQLSKFTYDVMQVMNASSQALVTLLRDTLAVIGLLVWIFYLNWPLALLAITVAPLIALIIKLFSRRLRGLSRELQTRMGDLNHVVSETLQAHREVKIFGGQARERRRFGKANNWVRRYRMKLVVASAASVPLVQFFAVIGLALVIYVASRQAAADELTVGGFVSLFGAMAMLLAPIKRLTKLNEQLQRGLAASESVFALIDEPSEPDHGDRSVQLDSGDGGRAVRFERVRFRYEQAAVIEDFSLQVAAGETIALVGSSGSGKTSLVGLLPRFYQPESGAIYLDGVNINKLSLPELRRQIAYVGQQVVLFNATVGDNIAYGAGDIDGNRDGTVDPQRLRAAAEAAHALEFIERLPAGFDTLIGENGTRLSGGQRQRLAIARALLKNAPLLILDEATSALDGRAERAVQAALERLKRGRTVFIVAHRLSTVESADRIVVLEQGRVVETGRHAELLALGGAYASLHKLQANEHS